MNTLLLIFHFSGVENCTNAEGRAPVFSVITDVFFARVIKNALIIRGISPKNTAKII